MKQEEQVKRILLNEGEISRNLCLRELYISRLGAIINKLKNEGWKFNAHYIKTPRGRDYIYHLIESPYKKVEYFVPNLNKKIVSYER